MIYEVKYGLAAWRIATPLEAVGIRHLINGRVRDQDILMRGRELGLAVPLVTLADVTGESVFDNVLIRRAS